VARPPAGSRAAVTAVLAIVGALVTVKLTSAPPAQASESLASSSIIKQVTTVPAAALTRAAPGPAVTPLDAVGKPGPPLTVDGKPAIPDHAGHQAHRHLRRPSLHGGA
jgi:hypothetical protein